MSIRALPPMEHTFTVSVEGTETGQKFDGTFTYKRPNLRVKSEISKTAAMLDGGILTLDEDTKFLHSILASLKHTLNKCPDWWKDADFGYELYDVNVILEIYKACSEFEKQWFAKVWEGKDEKKPEEKK